MWHRSVWAIVDGILETQTQGKETLSKILLLAMQAAYNSVASDTDVWLLLLKVCVKSVLILTVFLSVAQQPFNVGILRRDLSVGNMIIGKDKEIKEWRGLIDNVPDEL